MSDSSDDEVDEYISSIFEDQDLAAVHKTVTKYLNLINDFGKARISIPSAIQKARRKDKRSPPITPS